MIKQNTPHRARKRFGQNFLTDTGIINQIMSAIHPLPDERILEIGPGQGALTQWLIQSGARLDVVELDRDLVPLLEASYGDNPLFTLHSADALEFDYSSLAPAPGSLRVVGNLPYNISTPLIFRLLEHADLIHDMHFMLQLEVVNRLAANPGGKNWGRLGIMTQYHCRVESLFEVPPTAFDPAPKVQSAIVRLEPWKERPWPACDETTLRKVVKAAFSQRRKTLRNNLKGILEPDELASIDIDPGSRAETLELLQFIQIANLANGKI